MGQGRADIVVVTEACDRLLKETREAFPRFSGELHHLAVVINHYEEVWRRYHTLGHIAYGFVALETLRSELKNPLAVLWAWLGHDSIYVPTANGMNEYCSAEFIRCLLHELGAPPAFTRTVADHILPTIDHHVPHLFAHDFGDLEILLDVDLMTLAEPWETFLMFGESIRQEYPLWSDKEYVAHQAKFFEEMLARPRIFQSSHFQHLEHKAQENMRRVLVAMKL